METVRLQVAHKKDAFGLVSEPIRLQNLFLCNHSRQRVTVEVVLLSLRALMKSRLSEGNRRQEESVVTVSSV